VLITLRREGDHLADHWEFPGGKVEAGESVEEAIRRELVEELDLEVGAVAAWETVRHAYPDRAVVLHFLRCEWVGGDPKPIGCADLRWAGARELARLPFPPADAGILGRVAALLSD
jgi:mutator protein MutT